MPQSDDGPVHISVALTEALADLATRVEVVATAAGWRASVPAHDVAVAAPTLPALVARVRLALERAGVADAAACELRWCVRGGR